MIPIGIVTRNRHQYLDITLRSLSATDLPDDQHLVVYDDASDDEDTLAYLYSDQTISTACDLPINDVWKKDLHLKDVAPREEAPGLKGKVQVHLVGDKPVGVFNASCRAILRLWEDYEDSVKRNGLVLIQDDVVFCPQWLKKLKSASTKVKRYTPKPGLLCGMQLNMAGIGKKPNPHLWPRKGITAQCYYFTPHGLQRVRPFLAKWHKHKKGFDNKMCAAVRTHGAGVYLMNPAVCQHIGVVSLVRPGWNWRWKSKKGRVGYQSHGPFPMADEIREFQS